MRASRPVLHFKLVDCAPAGELVLVHRAQHLMLRIECPASLDNLDRVVENALRSCTEERTVLKKQWQPVNWHWVDGTAPPHRP
ncbi:hypothetical protein ACFYZN_34275 [Streptomyces sp. NPDC001777]|uniref:hypothetical protein n=1 Tax=Streptomyces sp. NPDC001777 TaxID=3364608 RepID=UPI0036AACB9E